MQQQLLPRSVGYVIISPVFHICQPADLDSPGLVGQIDQQLKDEIERDLPKNLQGTIRKILHNQNFHQIVKTLQ